MKYILLFVITLIACSANAQKKMQGCDTFEVEILIFDSTHSFVRNCAGYKMIRYVQPAKDCKCLPYIENLGYLDENKQPFIKKEQIAEYL